MEAKDTVMSEEQLSLVEKAYLHEDFSVNFIRLGRGHTEDLNLRIAQAQADISFKAGIKKMGEWIHSNLFGIQVGQDVTKRELYLLIPYSAWRTEVKTWGIDKSATGTEPRSGNPR